MAGTTSHEDAVGTHTAELRSAAAAEALLLDVVRRSADELLRVARAHSLCSDDAHDAYQRSLEQFLRHGRRLRGETAERWLFTVVKHEAGAVRRARSELVAFEDVDFERLEARGDASPEERALAAEAARRSAEALGSLKPQEIRALRLRATGSSYAEIQRATGWSYTKVNRLLTEGRRAFAARCAELEAGAACAGWDGALIALAEGRARAEELAGLRPHLRRCAACKATLRALHARSAPVVTALAPGLIGVSAVAEARGHERLEAVSRWVARLCETVAGSLQERAVTGALPWQAAVEASATGKLAAVAASTVALAGGGAIVAHDVGRPARPERGVTIAGQPHGLPQTIAKRQATRAAPPAPTRPVLQASAPRPILPSRVAASRSVGARPTSRPTASGSAGAREFGADPVDRAYAASEFAGSPRRPSAGSARASAHAPPGAAAAASAGPARRDFAPEPLVASDSVAGAPAHPLTASPPALEFGP